MIKKLYVLQRVVLWYMTAVISIRSFVLNKCYTGNTISVINLEVDFSNGEILVSKENN